MDFPIRKQIMVAFFECQVSYSPLTWFMIHSRKLNNKKTRLHGRCSPVTHSDGISSVERDNSVSVRNRNVQCLAIELFKIFDGMCLS